VSITAPARTVLVVEDNPVMRALIRSLIEGVGSVVHECTSGERALELYGELHPDLVLMDVRMGGMDGLSATRAIVREDPAARVIIVTDFGDARSRAAALAAGAAGFVPKDDLLELPALVAAAGGGAL
jgi:CheY-like chemotaxis protein